MSIEPQHQDKAAADQDQPEAVAADVANDSEQVEVITLDEARIQELETALAAAEAALVEQKDAALRASAEAENARRRASAEVDKARKYALERFAGELLPVVDNLERALQAADPSNEAIKGVMEGIDITHKSFISTIEKFGMQVVDPQGEPFDPERHQAMSMQESSELAPNTVMAVMQKGYLLSGRLLRPAMVVVSRAAQSKVDVEV